MIPTEAIAAQKDRFIKQQTELIEHLRDEVERLTTEVTELKEKVNLKEILINEIFRQHFMMGGAAINIELERIADNGMPLVLCYNEIPNGEYHTIVRVRK